MYSQHHIISALNMQTACSSEALVNTYQITRCHVLEDHNASIVTASTECVLLHEVLVRVVRKPSAFCEKGMFVTVLTTARHWPLSRTSWGQVLTVSLFKIHF